MSPTLEELRLLLKDDEALALKPYIDSRGFLTIGYGRCLDKRGISAEEADYLLNNDILAFEKGCHEAFPWYCQLNMARKAVILSMAFNMGIAGVKEFRKMIEAIDGGDFKEAASQMLASKWREQVGDRARRLAWMMEHGTFFKGGLKHNA